MNDKEAANKLIKLAKEHPDWYSKKDVFYAKQFKKETKRIKKLGQKHHGTDTAS